MTGMGPHSQHFVLDAGRSRMGVPRFVPLFGAGVILLGGVGAIVDAVSDQDWGAYLMAGSFFLLVIMARIGAPLAAEWWVAQTHFDTSSGSLECWHAAGPLRGWKRVFPPGTPLRLRPTQGRQVSDVSLGTGLRWRALGRVRSIEPRAYAAWTSWVRAHGWELDDARVLEAEIRLRPAIMVGEEWTTLPKPARATKSPWLLPFGPADPDAMDPALGPWLPADNAQNVGELVPKVSPASATSVALRIGTAPAGEELREFGALAVGASVVWGRRQDDVDFAVPVASASWRLSPTGRLEITLVPATRAAEAREPLAPSSQDQGGPDGRRA